MTGMGSSRGKVGSTSLTVEVKSVNHKFCEVHTRLPSRYQSFELQISQLVKKKLARGKIDIWMGEERSEAALTLNKQALKNYHQFLVRVGRELNLKDPINMSHIQNGASYWMVRDNDVKKLWPSIKKLLDAALDDMIDMRLKEGVSLKKNISQRLKSLSQIRTKVAARKSVVIKEYKGKLEKRISKLIGDIEIDETRLANEVVFFADRCEIAEELDRLQSHFKQTTKLLNGKKPCGRPLDFLIQEMNREFNTISSKSQDVSIAHWIVEAKSDLEKIREQVQNIE